MAFDESKVQFTVEELGAAKSADTIFEVVSAAFEDGIDIGDAAVIPMLIGPFTNLYGYLATGSKADYAKKLIALGVALARDNEWLDTLDEA